VIIIIIIALFFFKSLQLVACTVCQESAVQGYIPPAVDSSICMLKTPLRFLSRYVDEMFHVLDPFLTDRSLSVCLSVFRPPMRSNGRSSVLPVMFSFFRHLISELLRLIAAKLCHMIGN